MSGLQAELTIHPSLDPGEDIPDPEVLECPLEHCSITLVAGRLSLRETGSESYTWPSQKPCDKHESSGWCCLWTSVLYPQLFPTEARVQCQEARVCSQRAISRMNWTHVSGWSPVNVM